MTNTGSLASQWERQVSQWQPRRRNSVRGFQGTLPAAGCGRRQNVGTADRIVSIVGGTGLALAGRYKGNLGGVLLALIGAGLIYRGATGHCFCYHALGISTTSQHTNTVIPAKQGVQVEETVYINRPVDEIYDTWRDLSNLPHLFKHLKSVEVGDGHTSHWVASGPAGTAFEWDAEVLNDHENRLIAWRSLPDSQFDTAGSVRFKPADESSTVVTITMRYNPPGGKVADRVASWIDSDLAALLSDDLQHLKRTLEAGMTVPKHPMGGLS